MQESYGFNCEYVVGERDSFNLWDVCGASEMLELWPMYCQNIQTEVLIFVVRTNDPFEKITEAKWLLHRVTQEHGFMDSHLFFVFNTPKNVGGSIDKENLLTKEQLERYFKVKKLQ